MNTTTAHHIFTSLSACCPLTGTAHTIALPFTVEGTRPAAPALLQHPMLSANLPRAVRSQLPAYWLAMRALYRMHVAGLLQWDAPIAETCADAARWDMVADWATRAADAVAAAAVARKGLSQYPRFRVTASSANYAPIAQWCADVVSVYTYGITGALTATNRRTERAEMVAQMREAAAAARADTEAASTQKAALADAVARKRNAQRTLATAIATVCGILEDLPAAEWRTQHTVALTNTTKAGALCSSGILLKLRARINEHFPDAHFVGEAAAYSETLVLQHLDAVMLERAAALRSAALFEEDIAEAAELEAAATETALVSPAGRFSVHAPTTGSKQPAVTVRLSKALESLNATKGAASLNAPVTAPSTETKITLNAALAKLAAQIGSGK